MTENISNINNWRPELNSNKSVEPTKAEFEQHVIKLEKANKEKNVS